MLSFKNSAPFYISISLTEIYKTISNSDKKVSYKNGVYCVGTSVICALSLVIMGNLF